MKQSPTRLEKRDYSLLFREYMVKPIVPNASPATDAPHEKKFKKNVDSSTWMTIKKGRIIPKSMRTKPRLRRKRGEFIILLLSRNIRLGIHFAANGTLLI